MPEVFLGLESVDRSPVPKQSTDIPQEDARISRAKAGKEPFTQAAKILSTNGATSGREENTRLVRLADEIMKVGCDLLRAASPEDFRAATQRLRACDAAFAQSMPELSAYVETLLAKNRTVRDKGIFQPSVPVLKGVIEALRQLQDVPLVKVGKHYQYRHTSGDQTSNWQIEHFTTNNSPAILLDSGLYVVRCLEHEDLFFHIERNRLLVALELEKFPDLIEKAIQNHQLEKDGKAMAERYNLPMDQPIAHIRLFRRKLDGVVVDSLLPMSCLASGVLAQKYPSLRTYPILFSEDPNADLRSMLNAIRADRQKGIKHILIDINSHGMDDHFVFDKPMRAEDLLSIAREFPEFTFTFNTPACYGGGIEKLKDDPKLRFDPAMKRCAFFMHSKGNVVNIPSLLGRGGGEINQLIFLQTLLKNQGVTYGKAAYEADIKAKKLIPNDASAIIRGQYIGQVLPLRNSKPNDEFSVERSAPAA